MAPAPVSVAEENVSGGWVSHQLSRPTNAFSVDVEDYFQVEAFGRIVARESWESRPGKVVENTERVLSLLDVAGFRGTFFVLGWVAARNPELVRRIAAGGHEIASHGFAHEAVHRQTRNGFREDVRRARRTLEDLAGVRVRGYRAPTFSIGRKTWWAYDILAEEGYRYSSSVYPIAHDLYGIPEAPSVPFRPISGNDFIEIPVATVRMLGRNFPCGGGGYFRLMPYAISRWFMERVNRNEQRPCIFYCHPWEFDPHQPRIPNASLKSSFRHYFNVAAMERRVARLLRDFQWGRVDALYFGTRVASKAPAEWIM
jgi:polysaccharide deacetylase family protein (PEP-CTERM system associated)